MIEGCALLVAMAAGILLFLFAAILVGRWIAAAATKPDERVCARLCRIRIALGILLGFAAGIFVAVCSAALRTLFDGPPPCARWLLLLLLLALLCAFWLAVWLIRCGFLLPTHDPKTGPFGRFGPLGIVMLLAVLVMYLLARSCDRSLGALLAMHCARLFLLVVAIAILFLLLLGLEVRHCPTKPPGDCKRWIQRLLALLAALLVAVAVIAYRCPIGTTPPDLAMIGIHWDGKYPGEKGAHLRWGFAWNLPFPQGGFDLYRRPSSGGPWTLLNAEGRIHPIQTWNGSVVGGPVWKGRGKDRLPTVLHPRFEGANADQAAMLLDLLGRDPYATLYYVEGNDTPFTDAAAATAFADAAGEPRVQWQVVPMTLFQTMAIHPEIARLLGLYWIDETADAATAYDYRVVGYWTDRTREYVVENLDEASTTPLPTTALARATPQPSPTRELPDGTVWPTQAMVGLGWEPPTPDPDAHLTLLDGIQPVAYRPERQDLGPRASPGAPQPDDWEALPVPADDGGWTVAAPVVPSPREENGQAPAWPPYFAYDEWVDYHAYAYRLVGLDLFGRASAPSDPIAPVPVVDLVPPPAPTELEARIFQRGDPSLSAEERAVLFPSDSDRIALRVGWLWPDAVDRAVPDVKEFVIHEVSVGIDAFSAPSNAAAWRDVTLWEGPLGTPLARSAGTPDPVRGARVYQVTLTEAELPAAFTTAMTADDDRPTATAWITVGAVDHDDFNLRGAAAAPTVVVARDWDAPPAPGAPVRDGAATIAAGQARVSIRVDGADRRYTYEAFRLNAVELAALPPGGPLPAPCVESADAIKRDLQRRALASAGAMKPITASPVAATGSPTAAILSDSVDAAVGQRLVYVVRAIDPAGNRGARSCPSEPIDVIDGMPPAPPVITAMVGGESSITLTWNAARETDLERYEVLRTADPASTNEKRKMSRVLVADASGNALEPIGAADAESLTVAGDHLLRWTDHSVVAGADVHYRLVAIDTSGNASPLSATAVGRAVDDVAPAAPTWASPGAVRALDGSGAPVIILTWNALAELGARYLVQRRETPTGAWIPVEGWTAGITWIDAAVAPGHEPHYRIRAMDRTGNRSAWSTVLAVPP